MKLVDWIRAQWRTHGTKYLGTATSILGLMQGSALFSPKIQAASGFASGVLGLITLKRGFTNTKNQGGPVQ